MVSELTKCIRTNLDCADICATTGNILSRHTGYDANLTEPALKPAAQRVKPAGTNANSTTECMSTAGSVLSPAAGASRLVRNCCPHGASLTSLPCTPGLGCTSGSTAKIHNTPLRTSAGAGVFGDSIRSLS